MTRIKLPTDIALAMIFFTIACYAFSPELSAQQGMAATIPVKGYVVLPGGDTLTGLVKWSLKYVENNPVEIKFTGTGGDSKAFNAGEIKGFGNIIPGWAADNPVDIDTNYQDYVSVLSAKKKIPVFMHRLLPGRMTIFQNRSSVGLSSTVSVERTRIDGIRFIWEPGEGLSIGPAYRTDYRIIESRNRYTSYYVSKENNPVIKVDNDNYEENFKTLFSDCPAIMQELAKNPDLSKFKNFVILAEVYNRICPQGL